MNSQEYDVFTKALTRNLESDSRVLGLMAAGSTARQSHQPDEWSDHDFWVIAQSDAVAWFRTHREWLPNSEHIVLSFIDPIHNGLAVIYDNGHLIEFAVSDRAGLRHAKLNDFQLLIDRDKMAADMAQLHRATSAEFDTATWDDKSLFGCSSQVCGLV